MDKPRSYACMPCGHWCLCNECAEKLAVDVHYASKDVKLLEYTDEDIFSPFLILVFVLSSYKVKIDTK